MKAIKSNNCWMRNSLNRNLSIKMLKIQKLRKIRKTFQKRKMMQNSKAHTTFPKKKKHHKEAKFTMILRKIKNFLINCI